MARRRRARVLHRRADGADRSLPLADRQTHFALWASPPNEQRIDRYLESLPAPLSAILVGHTHVDHALDVPAFARQSDCAILGSRSLDTLLRAHGLPDRVRVCRAGETLALGEDLSVRTIASAHGRVVLGRVPYPGEVAADLRPPLRAGAYRHGTVYAFKVELGGRTLVHVGSAHVPPARIGPCDVLFVCVSGWRRVPDFVPRLLEAVQPEGVVPFHWDDFTAPLREGRRLHGFRLWMWRGLWRACRGLRRGWGCGGSDLGRDGVLGKWWGEGPVQSLS